jgi:DNA repair protein RecN (Recombination protein N)
MLSLLHVSNYAIIDDLEIEMRPGFTVMTGETGAGKSILVDALGLALGDRADAGAVRSGCDRAEIGLVFELDPKHPARTWLAERELDDEEICSLRRTISADGRSRAFINNRPVTLKDLRELGSQLVDIHGQHAHQSLLTAPAQRRLLDASANLEALSEDVARAFADWQSALRQLEESRATSAGREAELELKRFQLGELEALNLAAGETEALRQERELLRHIDQVQQAVGQAAQGIYAADAGSAYAIVASANRLLTSVLEHDTELKALAERLAAAEVELKEVGADLGRRLESLESDPARLEEVESRLYTIQQLARKHGVEEDELATLTESLRQDLAGLETGADSVAALTARCQDAEGRYQELAGQLSDSRREAAQALSAAVTAKLRELGLPSAEFNVSVRDKDASKCDSTGIDRIAFEVSTNPGEPAGSIDRIASGGELSRIGLALAVVGVGASPVPTFVFDEVDAGIGGAVAEVVGRRLRDIATSHQVLCVTHLAQVASQGQQHYRIIKLTDGKSSRTQVRLLDADQRIDELSRMLGGIEITAATRAHAEEMIRHAAGG